MQDFVVWVFGNSIDEFNIVFELFVVCFVILDMFENFSCYVFVFLFGYGCWCYYKSFGYFVVVFVRNCNDCVVIDGWVGEEVGFEFGWGDLVGLFRIML